MISIRCNGDNFSLAGEQCLQEFLQLPSVRAYQGSGSFAVAVNGCFVPRQDYHTVVLQQGDEVDIVCPIAGG
ncbi:sulfur carrier protein ThiS [Dasania sp. GY-MA-18]|uniref:Sulfur carrier protein ThiS n=1 Tax=Dasania phycosphaerae TaxID=2950436 RepID=A0A9J6RQL9_9GAMM|nr:MULTISPECIES: sulfur carrier protein ThiS [Dasania]MCR8924020.1 sulfur carrier protein ThiS [Dasania sp. GY-MA-18]MCZ0866593.1 sulfur carrier protein ThiS [Dasania phycosphaerae]MCZ0870178.1 sulfur carrier protein ThiS [Dasania phycosphaerae]